MISVLGLELSRARALLEAEGYSAVCVSTASRKGVDGDSKRVVRQRLLPDGRAELVYSVFLTDYGFKKSAPGDSGNEAPGG